MKKFFELFFKKEEDIKIPDYAIEVYRCTRIEDGMIIVVCETK